MKQINGTPNNVTTDILGRISLEDRNIFKRKDVILVKDNIKKIPSGYAAVITSTKDNINSQRPFINKVEHIDDFHEGDVVLVNAKGKIVFLYEKESLHNAIFVTERCNHRCIMCPQPPVVSEIDKTDFNLKLISLIDKNTKEVGITGGEPTLVGNKLFDIINHIKKYQPKASISLLSNGVNFADKTYAMNLAMCGCQDLQVDVPIFSDIAEIHNHIVGTKTFYKTIQGLYNLALFHVQIGLRIVVHKQTYNRLPQLADYIYHNFPFVSQVAFLQMETTGMAEKNIKELWIDPYDYNEELKQAVLLLSNRGICTRIYNAQLCVLPKEIRSFACNSISDWKDSYLPECEECSLKKQCGGLFESNQKHHSKHIKHQINYTPQPIPLNANDIEGNVSMFLRDNYNVIQEHIEKDGKVYDIPSGYGRNALWLATRGYKVSCYDIDAKSNEWLSEKVKDMNLEINVYRQDLQNINTVLCQLLINIHLYSLTILEKLSSLIDSGGILLLETPEQHGENYLELPETGELKKRLSPEYEILVYQESKSIKGHCAVKLIALKK